MGNLDDTPSIYDIRGKILRLFPLGSEWYDCEMDRIGTVELHFPPCGILLRGSDGDRGNELCRMRHRWFT